MPPRVAKLPLPMPLRGVNTEEPAEYLGVDEAATLDNFYFERPEALEMRGGLHLLATSPAGGVAAGPMVYWPARNSIVVNYAGNVWEYRIALDAWILIRARIGVWPRDVGLAVYGPAGASQVYLGATPAQPMGRWDGVVYTPLVGPTIPLGRRFMVRWSQLLTFGDPNFPHIVFACDALDATNWTTSTSYYLEFASGAGGEIVDWAEVGGSLYVFIGHGASQYGSVWRLDGYAEANFAKREVFKGLRCYQDTAAGTPQNAMFTTPQGVFDIRTLETGAMTQNSASESILSKVQAMTDPVAIYSPQFDAYLLSEKGTTETWVANLAANPSSWTRFSWDPITINCMCSGGHRLYMAQANGNVHYYDPATHQDTGGGGAPTREIEPLWKTADMDLEDTSAIKNIRGVLGDFQNAGATSVEVKLYKNHGGAPVLTKSMSIADQFRCNINARTLQAQLTFKTPTRRVKFGHLGLLTRAVRRAVKV